MIAQAINANRYYTRSDTIVDTNLKVTNSEEPKKSWLQYWFDKKTRKALDVIELFAKGLLLFFKGVNDYSMME